MSTAILDTGALIGFEQNDRRVVAIVGVLTSDPDDLRRLDSHLDVVAI